jgi:hypothetical protein
MHTFGKPALRSYQFAKEHLEKQYGSTEKIVMIGDN